MTALPFDAAVLPAALLRATLWLAAGWVAYRFLLRDTRRFTLNRAVLLGVAAGALTVPWWRLPANAPAAWARLAGDAASPLHWALERPTALLPEVGAAAAGAPAWATLLGWLWLAGAAGFGLRLAVDLARVFARLRATRPAPWPGVRLSAGRDSFSFGPWVVLAEADAAGEDRRRAVLAHERAHRRQGHTVDVLLAELVRAAFWFHPAAWALRRDVAENAEFLADRAAGREAAPSPVAYARRLIETRIQALDRPAGGLVHAFHQNRLERRIAMLTAPPEIRAIGPRYLAAILLFTATAALACAGELTGTPGEAVVVWGEQAGNATADSVYVQVDQPAEFPGGTDAMIRWMAAHLTYPEEAKKAGVEGKAFVQFVIDREGKVTDARVVKGFSAPCDAEALRVVRAMPDWTPARAGGEPVAMQLTLPVAFALPPKGKKKAY